jgi:hypothetical protein
MRVARIVHLSWSLMGEPSDIFPSFQDTTFPSMVLLSNGRYLDPTFSRMTVPSPGAT